MKGCKWMLAAALSVAMLGQFSTVKAAAPATIVDFDAGSYLLSDGTVWVQDTDGGGYEKLDFNLAELEGGYGITKDGGLVQLRGIKDPLLLQDQAGIIQLSGSYYLKKDGKIQTVTGKPYTGYSDIAMFDTTGGGLVMLTTSGELKATGGFGEKVAQLGSAAEVSSIDGFSNSYNAVDKIVVVLKSGAVQLYARMNYDKNDFKKYIPVTLTENGADAKFDDEGNLVVVLKDGTVWVTGSTESDRYKLAHSFPGLNGVTGLISVYTQGMYVKLQDGSVASYDVQGEQLEKLTLPSITDLTFQMDTTEMTVGDKVPVQINEIWPDHSTKRIPLAEADIVIEKPSLLQKQADGTLKAMAVGVTKVTVRSGSLSKTLEVSISASNIISTGAFVSGTMFLPVQAVFQELGASVQYNSTAKLFSIQLNNVPIQLQLGSDIAVVNGKKIKMSGKVQTVEGVKVFPASLLKNALGAELSWDAAIQSMTIHFGKAELQVQTKQTAEIYKKKAQGNLAKLIGKTYWINFFDTDYRFQKVTIVDVLPDYKGNFAIALKFSSGTVLNSYEMTGEELIRTLASKNEFFTTDPYKTYKWSNAVWTKIKAGTISTGMTKQQVELSWGTPINKSAVQGSGITVETWQYANFNYVTFTNGVVSMIYTS